VKPLATAGALALLALTPPAAQAHHAWQPMPGQPSAQVSGDATDPLIAEYIAAAQAFWGAAPTCPGGVAFHFVLYSDPSDVATARASQCTGWLNGRDWWPNAPRSEGWCAAVAHEVGHGLHGPSHSTDPSNVMYSATDGGQRWNWEGTVPGCARFGPAASTEPVPALHLRATGSTRRRRCEALRDRVDFAFRRTVRLRLAARWRRSCGAVERRAA
jgi:hypothetical protein